MQEVVVLKNDNLLLPLRLLPQCHLLSHSLSLWACSPGRILNSACQSANQKANLCPPKGHVGPTKAGRTLKEMEGGKWNRENKCFCRIWHECHVPDAILGQPPRSLSLLRLASAKLDLQGEFELLQTYAWKVA